MQPTHRIVKRPRIEATGGRLPSYPVDEIGKTLGTDDAVLVPYGARPPGRVVNSIGQTIRRRGFRFRHQRTKDGVLCWVEPPDDPRPRKKKVAA